MKKSKKIIALAIVGCLCVPMLAGCSSRLGEQSKIYFDSIKTVIDNYIKYNDAIKGGTTTKRENALDTPQVSIENGKYSFNKVDNASYYVVSVYETSGSLDALGSVTVQEDGSATYSGNMTDLKNEYSYQDWFLRVVAYPAEGGTLEESDAGFATYTVKGEVAKVNVSSQYIWNVYGGSVALTLNGFDYAKTAYPTNVKVTLTNTSTNAMISVDTGKLTSSSTEVSVSLPISTADYSVSLDCQWDEKYVTNPALTMTAGTISVDGKKNVISDGLSYTCGIFNQFEFPFISEGFKPTDVPTDQSYSEVELEDGVVFGTSTAGNNECTFRAYPLWTEKGYTAKEGAIYSFDVRIKGSSSITASPKNSPGSGSSPILFGQLDFFSDGTFELEIEYQYFKTDQMNAGVYYCPDVICEGFYNVEADGTYTLSFDATNAYEGTYQPIEELDGRASFYSEIDPDWKNSGNNNQGGGGFPGGGDGNQGGGGQGGGFSFEFNNYTWNTVENNFDLDAGSHNLLKFTATKKATATEGSTYSFTCATKDTGAPFQIDCTLELRADGTAVFHCGAAGPLSDTVKNGTWTEVDGVVTINLK